MFSHLHTHSYYSLLRGTASPKQLVQRAAKYDMPALALTDRNRLTGAIEFYDACQETAIQPILGLETSLALPPSETSEKMRPKLLLLAEDMTGWGSLCRISSALLGGGKCKPVALSLSQLAENAQGLLCLAGGSAFAAQSQAEALETIASIRELFPNRLYFALQAIEPSPAHHVQLAQLAKRANIPLVATGNVYYLDPADAQRQRLLSAIRLNCTLAQLPDGAAAPEGAFFVPPQDMALRFSHFPTALASIDEIRARCRLTLPLGEMHYPNIDFPEGVTAMQMLRQKVAAGAQTRYGEISPEIEERLAHELAVIEKSGYASLFLIMEEIIAYINAADVPYSSRGSAAGSLVAHCLGITSPDPLRLNLYFERFLNPARHSPPDIDTDLCSRRRDRVIKFVYENYGAERVAMVSTINRFRARSALRETAKAHGLAQAEISRLGKGLPGRGWGPHRRQGGRKHPYETLLTQLSTEKHRQIVMDAEAILGLPDHLSVHPGGVVIAPGSITDLAPTQLAGKNIRITQFDLGQIERLGLVKIDLLGTRGLSVLGDVALYNIDKMRIANYANKNKLDFLNNIPNHDPHTSQLIRAGRTVGCFGIESPGMQRTLREIEADSLDDIMIALALYRPGPMTGGLKDAFVNRHVGREEISHLHPALSSLLEETYGVILYQEQVLRIAHELAGFTLSEADLLRRAMSHFDPGDQMKTLKDKFITGAAVRSNVPHETGERIWELMAAFAGYGFPKAHSASYAQVAWRSAYCKVHYPAEFLAGVLANWGGYYSQDVYLLEARRMGLQLQGPHVNHAQRQFSVIVVNQAKTLMMGLDQVRDLTRKTQRNILKERPFHSLEDFLARAKPRPKEARHLVQVGALEGMGTIPRLLLQLEDKTWKAGQMELFSTPASGLDHQEDWNLEKKSSMQRKLLGTSIIAHPLELIKDKLKEANVLSIGEAKLKIGKTVRIAGMRHRWRRAKHRHGERVYHTMLDDLSDGIRILVMESTFNQHRELFHSREPLVVQGKVDFDLQVQEAALVVHKVWGR